MVTILVAFVSALATLLAAIVGAIIAYRFRVLGDERQTRFAGLYTRKADVLASLYEDLYTLHRRLLEWTSPVQVGGQERMVEQRKEVAEAFRDLSKNYYSNLLWLDAKASAKLEAVLVLIQDLIRQYDKIPGTGFQHQREVQDYLLQNTDWVNDWDRINKDADTKVGEMKSDIEKEFRNILGIAEVSSAGARAQPSAYDLLSMLWSDARGLLRKKRSSDRPRVR